MAALRIFVFCALLSGCGLALSKEEAERASPSRNLGQASLTGAFTALGGARVNLAADGAKIQVLMFVSETCLVCRAETEVLVRDRASRGVPTNAAFYSVVVGSVAEDAADWRDSLGVNWTVGVDDGDALFRTYCPELQTPCTVLRNPADATLTALTGAHPIAEWEKHTGAWTF